MSDDACIEVEDVDFHYNGNAVLEHVSFTVKSGEYLGIIGPNGGGKTTLLKIILGLLKPHSGSVKIFGQKSEEVDERYRIGYVPQKASQAEFYFPATVEEIVKSGRTARRGLFRRYKEEDYKAVEKAMEIAGIAEHRGRLISKLSGGERQRVFIARTLAGEPKILILDEPAVGVDIASQEKFYSFLTYLNRELGITIIFVSHDVGVIADEVNTVLCLNHRLICHGSPERFIKEEFLEEVYGKKVTSVFHKH
jgi:zinc transport system ATP-binding protein